MNKCQRCVVRDNSGFRLNDFGRSTRKGTLNTLYGIYDPHSTGCYKVVRGKRVKTLDIFYGSDLLIRVRGFGINASNLIEDKFTNTTAAHSGVALRNFQ